MARAWTAASTWLALGSLVACAGAPPASPRDIADAADTGRALGAKTESERELLRQLPALPAGKSQRVGEATVVAEAAYDAASGRTCRALHLTSSGKTHDRLACSSGGAWFFVPNVFGGADEAN